jgi:MFS family permease
MSAWGIVGTAGAVVLPFLSDYIGRRPVVSAASLLCAASLAVFIIGGYSLETMRVLAAVSGFFGFGLGPIVIATCVSELVPETQRGTAIGITNFFAVIVGTAVMPTVGGIVADHFGLGGALWIAVGMEVAIGVLAVTIVETAPRVVARRGSVAAVAQ